MLLRCKEPKRCVFGFTSFGGGLNQFLSSLLEKGMWIGRKTTVLDYFSVQFNDDAYWEEGPVQAVNAQIKRGWHSAYPVRYLGSNIGDDRLQTLQLSIMLMRYAHACGYQKLFDGGWVRTADNFGLWWGGPDWIHGKKLADGEKLEGVEWVVLGEIDHRGGSDV